MTKILVIKTSSLGDVIHTLPALTDAYRQYPDLHCDWVVEEAFAEIPTWHPAVKQVIPVALRRWRQQWRTAYREWHYFKHLLTQQQYDWVIDAQGLIKSAILTYQAKGIRCGLDRRSARESLASFAYQHRFAIPKNQHAITRLRQLFAQVLHYPTPSSIPEYGITDYFKSFTPKNSKSETIIFLHGTTWTTKKWPLTHWISLAHKVTTAGYTVQLPWGNLIEQEQAQMIAQTHPNIRLIPKGTLKEIAIAITQARAVIGVDTGLAHLAAALAIPSITLYGATNSQRTGTYGQQQLHLQAQFPCAPCLSRKCISMTPANPPCYSDLSVERVWEMLSSYIGRVRTAHPTWLFINRDDYKTIDESTKNNLTTNLSIHK